VQSRCQRRAMLSSPGLVIDVIRNAADAAQEAMAGR
jgi:hypothetical protein